MIEVEERPAVKAAATLTAEDAARVQALVHQLARPAAAPEAVRALGPTAAWDPVSSARIRVVESVVILAIMAYFASAALPALGLV